MAGTCVCTSDWLTYCGGACVNAATDPANCNTCGTTCNTAALEICETGGSPSPTCANVDWPRWTIPNSAVEVANGAPAASLESYNDNKDGTVTDNLTHLMWQQAPPTTGGTDGTGDNGNFDWADAIAYCSGLVLAGHHDWRLPSLIELQSLVDYSIPPPTINPVFACALDVFWSATPLAGSSSSAWEVVFFDGDSNNSGVENAYGVRCVR